MMFKRAFYKYDAIQINGVYACWAREWCERSNSGASVSMCTQAWHVDAWYHDRPALLPRNADFPCC